jgi:hypothetical protein
MGQRDGKFIRHLLAMKTDERVQILSEEHRKVVGRSQECSRPILAPVLCAVGLVLLTIILVMCLRKGLSKVQRA